MKDVSEHVVSDIGDAIFTVALLVPIFLMQSFILFFCVAKTCSTANLIFAPVSPTTSNPAWACPPAFANGC